MNILAIVSLTFICFILITIEVWILTGTDRPLTSVSTPKDSRYRYYLCAQIFNESERYLVDWFDHQFNVVGFKNVCIINVGTPLSMSLRKRFSIAYIEKKERNQEYQYCLSSCFIDEPMRSKDLLMIHDIDEYLNVRKANVIYQNYDRYDMFHFTEVRYGNAKKNLD